jgi:uncharacterized protein YtpQ (UPF0354 family)
MSFKEKIGLQVFVWRVKRVLRKFPGVERIDFDPDGFLLRVKAPGEENMFLHNLYEEYRRHNWQRQSAIIQQHVEAMMLKPATPETFEEAKPMLVPRIRERSYFEVTDLSVRVAGSQGGLAHVFKPLGTTHAVCLELDFPRSVQAVTSTTLETWGVTFDEAYEVAVSNLAAKNEWHFHSPKTGVYVSAWNDVFDASRMLLPDFQENVKVDGDPVVLIPNRNSLLVTGSRDSEGLSLIAQIGEQKAREEGRFMSLHAMKLTGGRWTDYMPESSHLEFQTFHRLSLLSLNREYQEQKDLLDKHHEQNAIDIFTATFMLYSHEEHGMHSMCVWTSGVESYLPETGRIALLLPEKEITRVCYWRDVQERLGHLIVPMGWTPERYHVTQFPDEMVLASIPEV